LTPAPEPSISPKILLSFALVGAITQSFPFNSYQNSVLIGLLLSDGTLIKRNTGGKGGAYFSLTQTCNPNNPYALGHVQLLFFVFNLFSDITHFLVPGCNWAITKGIYLPYLYFNTFVTSQFTELYNSWYPNGLKVVPDNIASFLDPFALAF